MSVECFFIVIPSLIIVLLITVYLLQQRKQPLETIQKSLSDHLGVTDLIGFSLVTLTREKEDLSGIFYIACLIPGLVLAGMMVQLLRMEEPDPNTWVPAPLQPFAMGLLCLLLYVGAVAWFAVKIRNARRTKTCYMCVSKSEGIVFVPVTFWSTNFTPKTPRIKDHSISPNIPLDDACEIRYLPKGEEGFSEGPIYYFENHGLGVSASKHWNEQLKDLVENVNSHLEKEKLVEKEASSWTPRKTAADSVQEEPILEADSAINRPNAASCELTSSQNELSSESQIIRPTGAQIAKGIGCILFALLSALGFLANESRQFPLTDQMDRSYFLGGLTAILIICYLCVKSGLKHFKTIVVDEMLEELDSRDNWDRQKAAKTLSDRKWEPIDTTQKVKLLVASRKYEEAISLDPAAVERMVDTLKIKNVSDGEAILEAFVETNCQTAVSPLIRLLVKERTAVSKRQIVKTLKELTGQDIGIDYNQWKTWLDNRST